MHLKLASKIAAGIEGDAIGAIDKCARKGGIVPVRIVFCDRVNPEIGHEEGVG